MKCRHHPNRDGSIPCQKMGTAYCNECLDRSAACTDPSGYCKFRTQCIIWENYRINGKRELLEKEAEGAAP